MTDKNNRILEIDKQKHLEMALLDRNSENFFSEKLILMKTIRPYLEMMREGGRALEHRIIFIQKGTVKHSANFERYTSVRGNLVLIPSHSIVSIDYISDDAELNIIGFNVPTLRHTWLFTNDIVTFSLSEEDLEIINLMYSTLEHLAFRPYATDYVLADQISSLLGFLQCIAAKQSISVENSFIPKTQRIRNNFMKCISSKEFIKCNIPDIAERMGVSAGYLSSTIKKETGKTAKYWIDERIVYDAKTALTSSDMAIEILAEELGFNSVSNFSNFFKTKTNLSPSEYRTKYKFFSMFNCKI